MNRANQAIQLRRRLRQQRAALNEATQGRREAEAGRAVEEQQAAAFRAIAASTAHDFNNFLQVILASAQIIGETGTDPNQDELTEAIIAACGSSRVLARKLVTMEKPEAKKQHCTLDLRTLVLRMEPSIKRLIGRHITFTVVASAPCLVRCDGTEIRQLILNLCINAGHALVDKHTGASLSLHLDTVGGSALLSVRDNGCGITEEQQRHVFEPFYTTKADRGGSGLGLSSAKRIAEHAEGTLSLTSVSGFGTTVRLRLPRVEVPTVAEREPRAQVGTA